LRRLSETQVDVWDLLKAGASVLEVAAELRLTLGTVLAYHKVIRRQLKASGGDLTTLIPATYETAAEVTARIAREIAEGKRCGHMLTKGPCSLLLPCWDHQPEQQADMANRPPAFTGWIQAKQSQAAVSMRRTLRPQGGTTRSGSPASQAAWNVPRSPK
jgi:hypothetical protein